MSDPVQRDILYIFLASPGDVSEEREKAREVVAQLNRGLADELGCQLELLGWEDVPPTEGRPQAVINQDVDRSHIFIGLLHRRWGEPTDGHSSGFEEEFERALERSQESGSPEMMIVFKRAPDEDDPGPQLRQVLEFKQRLRDEKPVFYREISTLEEWEDNLREWLLKVFARIWTGRAALLTQAERSLQARPTQATTASVEEPDSDQVAEPIPSAIRTAVNRILAVAQQEDVESYQDLIGASDVVHRVRLFLGVATGILNAVTFETLSPHQANLIYSYRQEIEPTLPEISLLARSMVGDASSLIPGWFWLSEDETRSRALITWLGLSDGNPTVRSRAIDMLRMVCEPPEEELEEAFWTAAFHTNESVVQRSVGEYLKECGGEDEIGLLEEALGADLPQSEEQRLEGLRELLEVRVNPATFIEDSIEHDTVRKEVLEELSRHRRELTPELLRTALESPSADLRILAATELCRRGELATDDARGLLSDEDETVRAVGLRALVGSGEEVSPEEIVKLVEYETELDLTWQPAEWEQELRLKQDELVLDAVRGRSFEDLQELLNWGGTGDEVYRILATEHFEEFEGQLRRDLDNGFERIREAELQEVEAKLGEAARKYVENSRDPKIDEFARFQFSASAMAGLAENGRPEDVQYGREFLDAPYISVRAEALRILERFGDDSDADRLFAQAEELFGQEQVRAISISLELTSDSTRLIRAYLQSESPSVIQSTLCALHQLDAASVTEEVTPLLQHEHSNVRQSALALLIEETAESPLDMLVEYLDNDSYYYNVVCWLDRLIFAAEPWQQAYRQQLLARLSA